MLLKTSLRSFLAHKGRMALSLVAVVLSVAFVSGTLVFSNTATSTFDKLFASTASDVSIRPHSDRTTDQQVRGQVRTVPVDTVEKVSGLPGVRSAVGDVLVSNAVLVDPATNKPVGPTTGAPTLTGNWTETPRPSLELTSGHAPQGSGQVLLDADTARKAGLGIGSRLRLITASGDHDLKISGIATFRTTNPGAALAFLDTPTAQKLLLGGATAYTSVELFGDGSRGNDDLKAEAATAVGTGLDLKTAAEQKAENVKGIGSFLDFMKYAMLGFAGISLLVGGFLIINTFSMLVAQRTREIGLMRAIGGSRAQVNASVLLEALILAVLGSTLGLFGGIGLATLLIRLMGAVGMNLTSAGLEVGASVPIASYTVGILITVLAAFVPARRAGRTSPMSALRDHGTPSEARANRIRAAVGLVLTAGGAALLVAAAQAGKAATGGALLGLGVVLTLVGFVVTGPLLASGLVRVLGAALPALFGPAGRLAQRNAIRNPRRTGATAAALMIGLALVVGASVFTSSMVSSTNEQIDKSVGADYIVDGGRTGLTPAMLSAAKSVKGLDHLTEQKTVAAGLTLPDGSSSEAQLTAVSPTFVDDFRLPVKAGSATAITGGGISVDEAFATDHHLSVGDKLTVDYGRGRTQSLEIGLITAKGNSLFDGNFFTGIDTVAKAVPAGELPQDAALYGKAEAGADKAKVLDALQESLKAYPQLIVKDQAGYKKIVQDQVNSLLYMVIGLLLLAIVVAVLGVVNTLALSVVERTREIGLLRAIGLSRRQLRRMIRLESVVIAVFGAVLGTGLGLGWGVTAQRVLSTKGLNTLAVPTGTIVEVLLASAVIGLLAAVLPAFRAGRMNVLAAIATD
ncbi:ABC transporter permease [Kitasatospora sp. HPMI-4]|uniref:ABC transporter permease n=1 Tax=Kitasatospora sp. HPMI-4 TaxID=3448443 RepID=UPI003F1D5E3B